MSKIASTHPPLIVEWSPTHVRVFDPVTRSSTTGPDLAQTIGGSKSGRDAIFAISHRSSFIRSVPVPKLSRTDIGKVLALKVGPLIPLKPGEFVIGFRLGGDDGAGTTGSKQEVGGARAIVGAVRLDSLRRIESQAMDAGVHVKAVIPAAFASWLCARDHGLGSVLIVGQSDAGLYIDVVVNGELAYSRSAPSTQGIEEADEEVARSFEIAGIEPVPILAVGRIDVHADLADTTEPLQRLAAPGVIERLLFSLELPERVAERRERAVRQSARRALVAAIVAVVFCYFMYVTRSASDLKQVALGTDEKQAAKRAKDHEIVATKRLRQLDQAKTLLDLAFHPAQSTYDVVTVLSAKAPDSIWLTGLRVERGKAIILRGAATNGKAVAGYVDDLSSDPRFRDVKLLFANKGEINTKPIVQFAISARALGSLPIDDIGSATPGLGGAGMASGSSKSEVATANFAGQGNSDALEARSEVSER